MDNTMSLSEIGAMGGLIQLMTVIVADTRRLKYHLLKLRLTGVIAGCDYLPLRNDRFELLPERDQLSVRMIRRENRQRERRRSSSAGQDGAAGGLTSRHDDCS